jgi:DNA-binding HxlR family transcriptional regulator
MKDVISECPIEQAMMLLGGRWPALLLYYLKDGPRRFSDLQRDNPTISHRMLTLELRKLEKAGVIDRRAYPGYPLRVDYELTASGKQVLPLIDAMGDWWEAAEAERRSRLSSGTTDGKCGSRSRRGHHAAQSDRKGLPRA